VDTATGELFGADLKRKKRQREVRQHDSTRPCTSLDSHGARRARGSRLTSVRRAATRLRATDEGEGSDGSSALELEQNRRLRQADRAHGLGRGPDIAHLGVRWTAEVRGAECGHALHLTCRTRSEHREDFGRSGESSGDRFGGHGQHAGLGEEDLKSFGSTTTPNWKTRKASAWRGDQNGQTEGLRPDGRSEPGREGLIGSFDRTRLRQRAVRAACSFGSTVTTSSGRRVRGPSRRLDSLTSVRGSRACWRRRRWTMERRSCFGRKDGNADITALEVTRHQVASATRWGGVNANWAGARSFGSEKPHRTYQDLGRNRAADIASHGDGAEHGP